MGKNKFRSTSILGDLFLLFFLFGIFDQSFLQYSIWSIFGLKSCGWSGSFSVLDIRSWQSISWNDDHESRNLRLLISWFQYVIFWAFLFKRLYDVFFDHSLNSFLQFSLSWYFSITYLKRPFLDFYFDKIINCSAWDCAEVLYILNISIFIVHFILTCS